MVNLGAVGDLQRTEPVDVSTLDLVGNQRYEIERRRGEVLGRLTRAPEVADEPNEVERRPVEGGLQEKRTGRSQRTGPSLAHFSDDEPEAPKPLHDLAGEGPTDLGHFCELSDGLGTVRIEEERKGHRQALQRLSR